MKVKVIEAKFVDVKKLLKENRSLQTSLEQAEIEICRQRDRAEYLQGELNDVSDKLNQLERAVSIESACWMCKDNKMCHQGTTLPQSPSVACGKFQFGYKTSVKHSDTVCDYKHGKMCWAQKGAPECIPEFCPVKQSKETTIICFNGASHQ